MPPAPDPSPPRASCPRCGNLTAHPFSGLGGVCLRCAGERAFVLGTDTPFESETIADEPEPAAPEAVDVDGPARIGPYVIIEELGRGGMARVYAARQSGLGRIVALKVFSPGPGTPPELEIRFLREAQTVARLHHPNIISIFDSGRAGADVYFSMAYIEGGDLGRQLKQRNFAPRDAAVLVAKVAAALEHAHGEGVLHRDLKPSNILLEGDEPRLADFGLAAQLETSGDFTSASGVFGTPHYLAPEAMRGGAAALSAASDLYALGVVLYVLLTGRTPFAGASPAELPALVHQSEPPAPRLLAPAVPRDLETICLKCLDRDPARRYASAAALAEDLRRFLAGEHILARPVSPVGHFLRWCRRRPALATVWLLVVALALGSTLAALWIARARATAERSLAVARTAEAAARESLRAAHLNEARAIRRTTERGRRLRALAAIADAARIRPGADLRDEALASLLLADVRPAATWDLAPGAPATVAFEPAGRFAAVEMINVAGFTRSPAVLRKWGAAPSVPPLDVPGTRVIGPLRYSEDGSRVMARYLDATLRVWNTTSGQLALTLRDRPLPGGDVLTGNFNQDYDFSPDATRLAVGLPGGGLSIQRVTDGAELARAPAAVTYNVIRYSPDGTLIAATRTQEHTPFDVVVFRADTLAPAGRLPQTASVDTFDWTSDSARLVVATEDNALAVFDVARERLLTRHPLGAHDLVQVLPLAADRLVATRGVDGMLQFINLFSGHTEFTLDPIGPSFVAAAPGSFACVTTSMTGVATRWEIVPPLGLVTVPPPHPSAYSVSGLGGAFDFSPDGRWVASGHGRYTILRDVATGRLLAEFDSGSGRPFTLASVAFAADGASLLLCSTLDGLRRCPIERAADGRISLGPPQPLDAEAGFIMPTWSADRSRCVLANFETGEVKALALDAQGAHVLARWNSPGIYNAALSPDARQVLVNCSGQGPDASAQRLRVHRLTDGAVVADLPARVSCDAAWSRDGRTALTSNGADTSTLWDTATWQPRAKLTGDLGGDVTSFTLSPDGTYAVIVHDDRIHLVSTKDGTAFATLTVPDSPTLATGVKFLPDARRFGVLWPDGRIDVIDPAALRAALVPLGLAW